jgi:hypothetical protein
VLPKTYFAAWDGACRGGGSSSIAADEVREQGSQLHKGSLPLARVVEDLTDTWTPSSGTTEHQTHAVCIVSAAKGAAASTADFEEYESQAGETLQPMVDLLSTDVSQKPPASAPPTANMQMYKPYP